ncbi:MAG: bifunctional (p)ppGpp synthetase/guanosine-3',5'-bis(diphosphate) 3'-pyrophosphohydrolase [Bacteroidales bacterium]|nr:bifunctional (p)ppGpp synthetase/guanosine-3',5'-bis(diphosphate) 3'-pyrophosphohydrolase [Candidatus Cryptobacteroides caccocaballi]
MDSTLFTNFDAAGQELVARAYDFADSALDGQKRGNGHPFIEHPIAVAKIAADEIGLPAECLAAVFLHEATRFNGTEGHQDVVIPAGMFSKEVLTMVDGLNKIATINPKDTRLEAENYKKLIVSYSTDPRVTVLKLADRLEIMRSLDIFPKASRERKILETLMLYIPLAHQLGLYNMKSEMEDIYFKHAEPEQYRAITNRLRATEPDRQKITTQFIEPLKTSLLEAGIRYKLKARTKTAFSIWKKMQKQKVDFDGVFDVFAIRFIIDSDECTTAEAEGLNGIEREHALCWKVFSYVTEKYTSDTKRLRDWISNPKPNGYESLHITVKNDDGAAIEVQIRTKRMDDLAENGLASHWSYKGIKRQAALDSWLAAVRYSLEHGKTDTLSPPDQEGDDDIPVLSSKEIFVFTPTGELRKLSAGATLLDFAFDIHSNLGVKCTGGRINGKAVSIREKLHTGDYVEIMSGKNQKPSADWLNFVTTTKARNKIRQKLKEFEYEKAAAGKEILERRLKNWKLEFPDDDLAALVKKHQMKNANEFFAAIGEGIIDVAEIKDYIQNKASASEKETQEDDKKVSATALLSERSSDDILVIDAKNVKNLDYRMAKCCNPVFGDDVFGFVTIKEGVKIHRMSCPNAARLIDMYPYRIQKVKWSTSPSTNTFQTTLKIVTAQEPSVISDIMSVIGIFKASVRSLNVSDDDRHGSQVITLKISVSGSSELDKVISQLRIIKNVSHVSRI